MYDQSILERFWSKVKKTDDCWEWTASRKPVYGAFWSGRYVVFAHRFSWEIHNGPIPEGIQVCHHCDNPICVRPDHLFLGTQYDNIQDAIAKGRRSRPNTRLNEQNVLLIRYLLTDGVKQAQLFRLLGIPRQTISAVHTRQNWRF